MDIAFLKERMLENPLVEPVDAVKLLYQNEFGCGHLVLSEVDAAAHIKEEMALCPSLPGALPYVDIGNGLCRLNLQAEGVRELPPLVIARMMAETAQGWRGSLKSLQSKLSLLRAAVISLQTEAPASGPSFTLPELDAYLQEYAAQGYPMVSHSPRYREAYAPAYRVVRRIYGEALPLLLKVNQRLQQDGRALVVLDGDCCAGKTTLAEALAPLYGAPVLHMDDFFLPPDLRTRERLQAPGGNIHYERFLQEALLPLGKGEPFAYHRYNCQTGTMTSQPFLPGPVCFIEGSYSHHPAFDETYRKLHGLRVFLSAEPQTQLCRLTQRNPALLPRFQQEWIPLEKNYFQAYTIPKNAEVVLRLNDDAACLPKGVTP